MPLACIPLFYYCHRAKRGMVKGKRLDNRKENQRWVLQMECLPCLSPSPSGSPKAPCFLLRIQWSKPSKGAILPLHPATTTVHSWAPGLGDISFHYLERAQEAPQSRQDCSNKCGSLLSVPLGYGGRPGQLLGALCYSGSPWFGGALSPLTIVQTKGMR